MCDLFLSCSSNFNDLYVFVCSPSHSVLSSLAHRFISLREVQKITATYSPFALLCCLWKLMIQKIEMPVHQWPCFAFWEFEQTLLLFAPGLRLWNQSLQQSGCLFIGVLHRHGQTFVLPPEEGDRLLLHRLQGWIYQLEFVLVSPLILPLPRLSLSSHSLCVPISSFVFFFHVVFAHLVSGDVELSNLNLNTEVIRDLLAPIVPWIRIQKAVVHKFKLDVAPHCQPLSRFSLIVTDPLHIHQIQTIQSFHFTYRHRCWRAYPWTG